MDCSRYEKKPIDVVGAVQKFLNISDDDFPIPSCPLIVNLCVEPIIPNRTPFLRK